MSTKDREPLITAAFRNDLLAALGGIIRELGGALRAANATPDHVHLLCSMPPTMATSQNCSTGILAVTGHGQDARVTRCVSRCGAADNFGVAPVVARYISDQEKHRRRVTFQEEFLTFLKKNGIAYDERYIWG